MAWNDHERVERRIDEQMKQSQGYLTSQQQGIANNQGAYGNYLWGGGGAPQQGNTYGYGSTTPHWSNQGPYFQGNGTDTPSGMPQSPFNQGGYYGNQQQQGGGQGGGGQDPQQQIMQYLQSLGPANSETLEKALPELQRMFPGLTRDNSGGPLDEIVLPNGQIVDLIAGAESGSPNPEWTYQTGPGGGGGQGGGFGGGVMGRQLGDYSNIMGRYEQFADTGGYSDQDLANIRARSLSPIRSNYSTAQQGMERQRALQGGYSPGYATAMGRFAREQGQLTSDASQNTEAMIAQLRQQGQLAGMGGMASMYGATPGLVNTFGNQMLASQAQGLEAAGLQNQLSLGMVGAQNYLGANVKGNLDSALGSANSLSETVGNVGNALYPWLNDKRAGAPGTWPGEAGGGGANMPPYWGSPTQNPDMDPGNWGVTNTGNRIRTDLGPGPFGGPINAGSPGRMIGGGDNMSYDSNYYNSTQNDPYRNRQPGTPVTNYTPRPDNW